MYVPNSLWIKCKWKAKHFHICYWHHHLHLLKCWFQYFFINWYVRVWILYTFINLWCFSLCEVEGGVGVGGGWGWEWGYRCFWMTVPVRIWDLGLRDGVTECGKVRNMSILQLYHPFHHTLYCYYIVPVHFMLMVYFKAITFYKTIKLSSHHILLLTDTHIHMHTQNNI